MDSMNLKDFRPTPPDFDAEEETFESSNSEIPATSYHEEINTLKIDKLSNRVTIISIIIPCLIGAILIFAYLDMKERVVDADQTKKTQVERISQQIDETINALEIKIAKNKYDLDTRLPELNSKQVALEGQITKFASAKADSKSVKDQFATLEKQVENNAKQGKAALQAMEKADKQTLLAIKENQAQMDKAVLKTKEEIALFKKEFDARLLGLSDYEQQIGELRMNFSILDKKYKRIEEESVSRTVLDEKSARLKTDFDTELKNFSIRLETLDKKLNANISRMQKDLDLLSTAPPKRSPIKTKPAPQINIDSSESVNIEAQPLTQ